MKFIFPVTFCYTIYEITLDQENCAGTDLICARSDSDSTTIFATMRAKLNFTNSGSGFTTIFANQRHANSDSGRTSSSVATSKGPNVTAQGQILAARASLQLR